MTPRLAMLVWTLIIAARGPAAHAQIIVNSSFEAPALPTNSFLYNPTGTPWVFTNDSGIINNSTGWQSGGVHAPNGSQVGFIQSPHPAFGQVGSISQTITLPATGVYTLSYFLAGRSGPSGEGGVLPFDVFLDNTLIGSDSSTTGMTFQMRVMSFGASAGAHTFLLQGRRPVPDPNVFQDNTAFFDMVMITPVPEPSSLALASVVAAGVAHRRWRRK